ncbi:hypothetical protein [Sphaerimonospora thailandensis]|uniref:DoxX-like protein n=1 Tax=Sphaerimonospora thailandensis TaxID=795644 RepID=A0A8J3W2F7_9ACTN|nr:hypothetical protein [Sphaerimonospora thailandensis]GIH73158.1 hypothetical protein Mth01_54110 [Sphaerimonospora thailandensis]
MTTTTHQKKSQRIPTLAEPGFQAFWALRLGFAVLPIVFGLDKFAKILTGDWTRYLANGINDLVPGDAETAMHLVGVTEIVAGLAVLVLPRLGAPLVAVWLGGIIVDLLMVGGYGDVALRDFGLMAAALVLTRLAWAYPNGLPRQAPGRGI